jgi:hypothetical protein
MSSVSSVQTGFAGSCIDATRPHYGESAGPAQAHGLF